MIFLACVPDGKSTPLTFCTFLLFFKTTSGIVSFKWKIESLTLFQKRLQTSKGYLFWGKVQGVFGMFVLIITKLLWNSDSPAERSAVAGLPEVFFISLTISIFFSWKNTMKPTTKLKKKGKNNGHIDFKRQMIHRNFFELKWCQELMEKKFVNC